MRLNEVNPLFETPASDAHESAIAGKLKAKGFIIWAEPKGSDAGWPDVGASIVLPSGKKVYLHIEVKMSKTDPMGSLRSWSFDGKKFIGGKKMDDNQKLILAIMNNEKGVVSRAKKLLSLLKKYFHKKVTTIQSGSLSAIKPAQERYDRVLDFLKNAKATKDFKGTGNNFQLSNPAIKDQNIGKMILDHYRNKFKKKSGGDNIMMFILGNEMFLIPGGKKPTKKIMSELFEALGVDDIPYISESFAGSLEVRTQFRKLSKKGKVPPTIDVMATLRAVGSSSGKGTVLS